MDKKSFKSMKNNALGSSMTSILGIGDIVSWKTWLVSLDSDTF